MKRYLLVAHYEGDKTPLWNRLRALSRDGATFHIAVPATPPPTNEWTWSEEEAYQVAKNRLDKTLEEMKSAGLQATGEVLNYSVQEAIEEALKKDSYDELIVSTAPEPEAHATFEQYETRVRRFSQIPMRHIVNQEAQEIERA